MDRLAVLRRFYARYVTASAEVVDERIVNAFASVEREHFVGPGPWHIPVIGGYIVTETDDPAVLYQDILVGLAPGRGINNGEPSLHAKCLAAADPQAGEVVVHVGAGTGYYTAILADLVGQGGHVHGFEVEPDIAARAAENLARFANVTVHARSALGVRLPLARVIYVSAGTTHVPAAWLDALALGGRLVLPLTPNERLGCMLLVTRLSETAYAARIFATAAFIPCIGARDEQQSRAVAAALDAGSTDEVRSLRRGTEPDGSAWCIGTDWWLSTAQPGGCTSCVPPVSNTLRRTRPPTSGELMFDHVKFGVSDYAASKAFFLKALEPLGVTIGSEGPPTCGVEICSRSDASLCLFQTDEKPAHLHLAFAAENRQQVEAFYRAALEAGGKDNGAPGLRPRYHANYYAAYVIGPDGHNVEVVCHEPDA